MLKPVPAREASGLRHDVPQDLRREAMELKSLIDRYAGAVGRHWIADEEAAPASDLLLQAARLCLNMHARHMAFVRSLPKEEP